MSLRQHLLDGIALVPTLLSLLMAPGRIGVSDDAYRIARSLRLNSADGAYLSRTFGAEGNRKTWTLSFWYKPVITGTAPVLHWGADSNNRFGMSFTSNGELSFAHTAAGTPTTLLTTNAVFRDPTAHYHFVIVFDSTQATAANRLRLEVNGVAITSFSTDSRSSIVQNTDYYVGDDTTAYLGTNHTLLTSFVNGYLSEILMVNAQALTSASFGTTDPLTGVWVPKRYTGTFGVTGFWLDFSDNSAATAGALGADRSGNGNNFTPTNIAVTAGVGNDSLVDVPTNYGVDSGAGGEARGNYAIFNSIMPVANITTLNAGLTLNKTTGSAWGSVPLTFGLTSGKWFATAEPSLVIGDGIAFGCAPISTFPSANFIGSVSGGAMLYKPPGTATLGDLYVNNSPLTPASQPILAANDLFAVAIDIDAGKAWLGFRDASAGTFVWYNSTAGTTGDPATGANPTLTFTPGTPYFIGGSLHTSGSLHVNAGARVWEVTCPSGFKALCTQNLSTPSIVRPSAHHNTLLYTGNGALTTRSGLAFDHNVGLVWVKSRSAATDHAVVDSARGTAAVFSSISTAAEVASGGAWIQNLSKTGFSTDTNASINTNAATYAAWAWGAETVKTAGWVGGTITPTKEVYNLAAGISIVTFVGNGAAGAMVPHSLGRKPVLIIIKERGGTQNWIVYSEPVGPTAALRFNTTDASSVSATWWNDTAPTTQVFSLGTSGAVNGNGLNLVAYIFAEIPGFSRVGSFTTNGTNDNAFAWCGFRPKWLLYKTINTTSGWGILDGVRNTQNPVSSFLLGQVNNAEGDAGGLYDFVSNGIKARTTGFANGNNYLFMAFAENPFKYARAR